MSNPALIRKSVAPPFWLLLPAAVFTAALCTGVVVLQAWAVPLSAGQFAAVLAGVAATTLLVFGPSRLILTLVFLLALLDHQFRSPAIVPFADVEWHPRELLLLLLFAHAVVALFQRRLRFHWTPLHFGMLLYTVVFVYMAWRGLWLGNDLRAVIAECRAPLFLGAFWVFAGAVRDPRELPYFGYIALCMLVLLATATLAAFLYFAVYGPLPNTQNALGEFVPRRVQGMPLQSIRPGGHVWLEAGLVVSLGMLLCPREPWYRKVIYLGLVPLFALAIAAGLMRTAAVAVGVSATVLLWLNLPRVGRGLVFALVLGIAAFSAALLVWRSPDALHAVLSGDRSLTARAVETRGALEAISGHPFFGAGLGASFQALDLRNPDSGASAIVGEYRSLHNVWLYFTWKGGLVGLALVALALGGMLLYSQIVVNRLPSMSQRCLGRALQAVLIGQLAASAAMPRLTYANGALFLVIWAMAVVLLERAAHAAPAIQAPAAVPESERPCPFPEPV